MGWSVKKRRSRRNKYIYLYSIFIRTVRPYLLLLRFGAFNSFLASLGRNQMCRVHVALPKRPLNHGLNQFSKADNRQKELTVLIHILSLSLWKETKGFKRQWVIWWKPNNQEADQVSGFRVLTPIHITIFSCSLLTYTCGGIHKWHIILQSWVLFWSNCFWLT